MVNEQDRVRKAREQYEAIQARQKRVQDACERLQKPGVLLKMSIVLVGYLIMSLGFLDPIFKLLGLDAR
jgi:hypothetical protein